MQLSVLKHKKFSCGLIGLHYQIATPVCLMLVYVLYLLHSGILFDGNGMLLRS